MLFRSFNFVNDGTGVAGDTKKAIDEITIAREKLSQQGAINAFGNLVGAEQNTLRFQNLWQELGAEIEIVGTGVKADIEQAFERFPILGKRRNQAGGTLSGGESQRIRLASQIGSGLSGVVYVLDEPSIGLHQCDNERLLGTLEHLRSLGNTVIVVEHDEDAIRLADYLVDMGPGAGIHGGRVMAQGTFEQVQATAGSLTGQYLAGTKTIAVPARRTPWLPVQKREEPEARKPSRFPPSDAAVRRAARSAPAMPLMIGPIIGPPIGGLLTDLYHWRLVFVVSPPFAVLAIVGGDPTLTHDINAVNNARHDLMKKGLVGDGSVRGEWVLTDAGLAVHGGAPMPKGPGRSTPKAPKAPKADAPAAATDAATDPAPAVETPANTSSELAKAEDSAGVAIETPAAETPAAETPAAPAPKRRLKVADAPAAAVVVPEWLADPEIRGAVIENQDCFGAFSARSTACGECALAGFCRNAKAAQLDLLARKLVVANPLVNTAVAAPVAKLDAAVSAVLDPNAPRTPANPTGGTIKATYDGVCRVTGKEIKKGMAVRYVAGKGMVLAD